MKTSIFSSLLLSVFAVFSIFLFTSEAYAVRHIINFGGNSGTHYCPDNLPNCPNTLALFVGDTVVWDGGGSGQDFSFYDLDSVAFPDGANPFPAGTNGDITQGNTFTY